MDANTKERLIRWITSSQWWNEIKHDLYIFLVKKESKNDN